MKTIIEYSSSAYPKRLRYINNPPSRLYVDGNIDILNQVGIAVIGSRTNTPYGERMCKKFVKQLVEYQINIISGLALGIDYIAHKTCLINCGQTIAVLPSGIDNIYPYQHKKLAEDIIKNGGIVISEYENKVKADSKKFLERNRIVAGLGIGTLVIEAGHRSGTSVTAKYTKKNGNPVFCIPSSLENIKGKTTNELIKNGAKLVTEVEDIINYYSEIKFYRKEIKNIDIKADIPTNLRDVYDCIGDIPQNINEISRKTGLSVGEISYQTTILELEEKIKEVPGRGFIINSET